MIEPGRRAHGTRQVRRRLQSIEYIADAVAVRAKRYELTVIRALLRTVEERVQLGSERRLLGGRVAGTGPGIERAGVVVQRAVVTFGIMPGQELPRGDERRPRIEDQITAVGLFGKEEIRIS